MRYYFFFILHYTSTSYFNQSTWLLYGRGLWTESETLWTSLAHSAMLRCLSRSSSTSSIHCWVTIGFRVYRERQNKWWMVYTLWKWRWCDVTYSQSWWPILGICALLLTHPRCTHTQQWTHTHREHTQSSGQSFMLRRPGSSWGFSALLKGTSVVLLKEDRALYIHSPHLQLLPARDSNSQPLDYESASLTIRPRLPHPLCKGYQNIITYEFSKVN